jgi:rhodanese-related sulfurtransferase
MPRFIEFFLNHWDLFLSLAIILAFLIWQTLRSRLSGYKELDPAEAVRVMNQNEGIVLDVREESEVKDGRIVNAIHIPLGALRSRIGELEPHRSKPIIVNCRSGHRSASACGVLAKAGFATVYNLRGGINAWQSAGLPTAKSGKAKKK